MHPRSLAALLVFLGALVPCEAADQDVVINEIMYHPDGGDPNSEYDDEVLEYIELYNRGGERVDLSGWSFDRGIRFLFPANTFLEPGAYLVVCADADTIRGRYGIDNAIGNWQGRLNNQGEHVTLRNDVIGVDGVGESIEGFRYNDRLPWPVLPDGDGPSLERISPFGSNDDPANWAASSAASSDEWTHVTREGRATSSRLYIYLLGVGEALVDDVQIYKKGDPGRNFIRNGGFEDGLSPWNLTGNHDGSFVDATDAHGGTHSLHIVSTGRGASNSNSLNCYTSPDLEKSGPTYVLDFWVKFLSGTDELESRLSYGGLRGQTRPTGSFGTPGARNSVYSPDIPAFITDVRHTPAMPRSADPVFITARVRDDDAVAAVTLAWKRYGESAWQEAPMDDDGAHGDGVAGDGVWGARLDPQSTWTRVLYRVTAIDSGDQVSSFPVPGGTAPVRGSSPGPLTAQRGYLVHPGDISADVRIYYLFVESSDLSYLNSNRKTPVPAMVSYDGELFTNMTVNYRGQTSLGNPKKHWKWRFPKDQRFEGQKSVNVNSSWGDKAFIRSYLAYRQFRLAGEPGNLVEYARVYLNRRYYGLYTQIEQSNEDFLRRSGLDPDGHLFKAYTDARHGTGGYEWKVGRDRSTAFSELGSFLTDVNRLTGNSLRDYIAQHIDVPSFTSYLAATCVIQNADHPAKNYYIYQDYPNTGRWTMLPWDMDLTWGRNYECGGGGVYNDVIRYNNHILLGTQAHPKCDGPWNGVINAFLARLGPSPSSPTNVYARLYYQRVEELLDRDMNEEALYPLIETLRALLRPEAELDYTRWNWWGRTTRGRYNTYVDEIKTFIRRRNDYLRSALRTVPRFPPVEDLTCTRAGTEAYLSWTIPATADYDEIRIYRDGERVATVGGDAEAASAPLDPDLNANRFEVVAVYVGVESEGPRCTVLTQGGDWITIVDDEFGGDPDLETWALNGDATVHGGELHVVDSVDYQTGSAFLRFPVPNKTFQADFAFSVRDPEDGGGEGFTFAWIRSDSPEVLGAYRAGLGFWGLDGYAIEFDTSASDAYDDPDDNHIALNKSEDYHEAGSPSALAVPWDEPFESGASFWVRVLFAEGHLTVSFLQAQEGGDALETVALDADIPDYVLAPSYFGFTGATSGENADYRIERFLLQVPEPGGSATPPTAAFEASPTNGSAPLDVTFTNQSDGDVFGYQWDFGDGTGSQQTRPTHTYEAAGDFTVTLTAIGPGGVDEAVREAYIHVTEPPRPDFDGVPHSGYAPLEVHFENRSEGDIDQYFWDLGDGSTSLEENPVHTYEIEGTYTVSLTATGVGGSATETKEAFIEVQAPVMPPQADFTAAPTSGPPPLEVHFTNLSTGDVWDYFWWFGDGAFTVEREPVHTYAEPGVYTVSLTAQGPGGNHTTERTDYIVVGAGPGARFLRGDTNDDERIDISDAIRILGYLFSDVELTCLDAADVDDSGQIDLADPIYLLGYLFTDGPAPRPPFPEPGEDPTQDDVPCDG